MPSSPIQFNALARALKLTDPIERKKAARRELNRMLKGLEPRRPRINPGPVEPPRSRVMQATHAVLRKLFPTIDGLGWTLLLERTPEEVNSLSLDAWKRTWEGRVCERDGQEGFERWLTEQKIQLESHNS
jgi:hypothetical protein